MHCLLRPTYPIKPKSIPYFPAKSIHIPRLNPTSLSSYLQDHINSNSPSNGQKIHSHILKIGFKPNTNISIKLLILHLKSGCLSYARRVFDEMPKPTTSAYNYMLAGYSKHGQEQESLDLIRKMAASTEKPDGFSFSMMLKLSASLLLLDLGKSVHTQITKLDFESDDVLFTALVDSYAKNGKIDYARRVYDKMSERNVICSTAMISGYMKHGSVTIAEEIFEKTIEKDTVVFNAMIEGYSKTIETANRALEVYIDMQRLDFRPTISTFSSIIGACSILSAFEIGQQVHSQLMKTDSFSDVKLGSALVDMYSKCGRIVDARRIFNHMPERNVVSWTSMIDGYGKNGSPSDALQLFDKMRRENKTKPNYVTFLSALSACGHSGLISTGWEIFNSMERDYSLKPRMEHYACMVDLLGRAGSLHQALDFITKMPERPDSDVWGALLSACRLHGDVEMAGLAANELFKLSRDGRPGAYVALSNTFAAAGRWEGVSQVRGLMKERGVSKDAGCSWVGTDSGLCGFHVGKGM
ncbi:pentatricopeptide repeat-containing protein At1g28690, mitochondrial [Magnolia sinica]|uniref:pentatricopeptide repeat-containing protein At1g28690, mitochondrial n=1 Tax=Magnolia sinica TaxID=86752 RepID=UPI002658EDFD|nr:pentatricopeptide repeat-containing protein At1g28690, mitochondrial [Magnolia sinica]